MIVAAQLYTMIVAVNVRQRGYARALVQAAADHYGVAIRDLGWLAPLTRAGDALVRSLYGDDGFYVG
jgi:hypothetical protein